MNIDKQLSNGIYLLSSRDESVADLVLENDKSFVMINLAGPDAHKVPFYFKKEKLQWITGVISSHSEYPNMLFSSVIHLLQKTDKLIIGTIGLSTNSISEIISYLLNSLSDTKLIIFINLVNSEQAINAKLKQITQNNLTEINILL